MDGVALLLWAALLVILLYRTRPGTVVGPGQIPGAPPDSQEYAYGAIALLHGTYVVDWSGVSHIPRYPPGYSLLLAPAVGIGGIGAADRVASLSALVLAVLAGWVALRLSSPLAAPLATALVAFPPGPLLFARVVMSDLPAACLSICEMTLLAIARQPILLGLAGVLAGALVWVRLSAAVLVLAGVIGLMARRDRRVAIASYLGGAVPVLVALLGWQQMVYGSPLTTGYQASGAGPGESGGLGAMFGLQYVFGRPVAVDGGGLEGADHQWGLSNALAYPLDLLGTDSFLIVPAVGLLGLASLVWLARQHEMPGVIGRFGLAATAATLVVYLPYFYQAPRFLLVPSSLLSLAAAVGTIHAANWLYVKQQLLGHAFRL